MPAGKTTNFNSLLETLEQTLEEYLVKKAPTLPENWKKFLVRFLPWITLMLFVLAIPVVLAFLGLSVFILPFTLLPGLGAGLNAVIAWVVLAGSLVLEAMAIPGLFKQEAKAWRLLYYSVLLSGVYNLFTLSLGSLIIGTGLSLYILFQIKSYYK